MTIAVAVIVLCLTGCGKGGVGNAEDQLKVAVMQESLAEWVSEGGPESNLISNTNQILDDIHGRSKGYRREQIDEALATVSNSGCNVCVSALEDARP